MRISASQIKEWSLCQKKWYFNKVLKLDGGGSGYGATFGSVVHGVLENLHQGKDLYPLGWDRNLQSGHGELAQALVAKYQEEVKEIDPQGIESYFKLPVIEGVELIGYVDLWNKDSVVDHKTTGNLKYALDAKELASDTQMLIYAYALKALAGDIPPLVSLKHNVFLRKSPAKVKTTQAYATREAIEEQWETTKKIAEEMKAASEAEEAPKVSMGGQCQAYGGCPYAGVCAGALSLSRFPRRKISKPTKEVIVPPVSKECLSMSGLTLYIGCTPIKGDVETMTLDEVMTVILAGTGDNLMKYQSADTWHRRDALVVQAQQWAAQMSCAVVVPARETLDGDEKSLLRGLYSAAKFTIEPLG
tara:strand:- start:236 stop:1315 length:1080 start_codon:yes stop_codon:yes gene_type:complete